MKKLFFLPLLAILMLALSCSKDNDGPNLPQIKSEVFFGKLMLEGSVVADDSKCGLDIVDETAAVTLYGVTFAPAMPAMDIVVPMLSCKKAADSYVISGKNIVPLVKGAPMDMFRMSAVEATLTNDKFVFSAVTPMGTIGFSNALENIQPVKKGKSYKGSLAVGDFSDEAIVDIVKDGPAGLLDIVLNDVKFAPNMPLTLDITLKEVPYLVIDGAVHFSAQDVAPYINAENEPAAAYMFASVGGRIEGGRLFLDAAMAEDLAAYVAGKEFTFEGEETAE